MIQNESIGDDMTLRGIYVDDDPNDQNTADLLSSRDGSLTFTCLDILSDLTALRDQILAQKPDIIALDYRLDDNSQNASRRADYKGGALAQAIREKQDEDESLSCPIILVSNESKIENFFKPEKTTHDLFDDYYAKETITADIDRITSELAALALGYKLIQSLNGGVEMHLDLFDITAEDWEQVEANDLVDDIESSHLTHIKSRYILKNFIKRAGATLSRNDVLARLGIDLVCNNTELLFVQLKNDDIDYTGIFSNGWERYWTFKFEEWCFDFFGSQTSALTAAQKVDALNAKYNFNFTPVVSRWMKTSDEVFAFLCASCGKPTELKYSLAAYDPYRPEYSEGKRICYTCVKTDAFEEVGLRLANSENRVKGKVQSGMIVGKQDAN